MQFSMVQQQGGSQGIELSDSIFNAQFNEALVHQVVTAYLANARQGTRAQKTRAEVSGGGKKPWRQKGTGRARVGSSRNPIWRGGGITFAAKPQDFSQKVNKKMYRSAIRAILSSLVQSERLVLIDTVQIDQPKTKCVKELLEKVNIKKGLIVVDELTSSLQLAARNLPNVLVCVSNSVDPVNLIKYEKVLMTLPALKELEERLI